MYWVLYVKSIIVLLSCNILNSFGMLSNAFLSFPDFYFKITFGSNMMGKMGKF